MTWRSVMTPPDQGELVLVKDDAFPDWEEPASLVAPPNIWISELSGHIVYPTHWKTMPRDDEWTFETFDKVLDETQLTALLEDSENGSR